MVRGYDYYLAVHTLIEVVKVIFLNSAPKSKTVINDNISIQDYFIDNRLLTAIYPLGKLNEFVVEY